MPAKATKSGLQSTDGSRLELTVSRPELLVEGSDRSFRQLVHDTLAFAARIQEVRNRLGSLIGLSGTQYTLLISIAHLQGDGGVGVNRVAEQLHLSGAFVTIEVKKLVAADLVRKRTNPGDRRRVLLTVTQKGQDLLSRLATIQRPVNDTIFGCVSVEEFKVLRDAIAKLVDSGDRSLHLLEYLAQQGQGAGIVAARASPGR